MVRLRHRLTVLAAVLLALAVGILVGSTALVPAAHSTVSSPATTSDQLLVLRQAAADDFARDVAPALVHGALSGVLVLVVMTPDVSTGLESGALRELAAAGATVAGQVRLRADLLDASSAQTVDDVVAAVVPAGLKLPVTSAVDRAGVELASVLLTAKKGFVATPEARQRVLGGFVGADLLAFEGPDPLPATAVLVLTGGVRDGRSAAVAALAGAFRQRGGVVVAGPASASLPDGAVAAVRSDSSLRGRLSTVDGADGPAGLIAVVLALAEQDEGGVGQYGSGAGAQSAAPRNSRNSRP